MTIYERIFYFLYRLFSKSNKRYLMVFATTNRKDLFGNLSKLKEIAKEEGFECRNVFGQIDNLPKAIRAAVVFSKAKYVIYDAAYKYAYLINKSEKITNVQIWHAAGAFKKFGMDSIDKTDCSALAKQDRLHGHYNLLFVSSEYVRKIYSKALRVKIENVIPSSLPRYEKLDGMFRNEELWKKYIKHKYNVEGKTIILYSPTFRENNGKRNYAPVLRVHSFVNDLPENFVIALRLHPRAPKQLIDKIFNEKKNKRILNWCNISNEQALIGADIVISDYSSIVFDAVHIEKPVLFFVPDIVVYGRGFYFDPLNECPDNVIFETKELKDVLIGNITRQEKIIANSRNLKEKYSPYKESPSTTILEKIKEYDKSNM